jgi:hypothetical protein
MVGEASESDFDPLLIALAKMELTAAERDHVTGNYMYMFTESGIFAYKHAWAREYVHLTEAGVDDTGVINTSNYPLYPAAEETNQKE